MCTALAWFGHLDLLGCMPSFRFKFNMSAGKKRRRSNMNPLMFLTMGRYDSCESSPI